MYTQIPFGVVLGKKGLVDFYENFEKIYVGGMPYRGVDGGCGV